MPAPFSSPPFFFPAYFLQGEQQSSSLLLGLGTEKFKFKDSFLVEMERFIILSPDTDI